LCPRLRLTLALDNVSKPHTNRAGHSSWGIQGLLANRAQGFGSPLALDNVQTAHKPGRPFKLGDPRATGEPCPRLQRTLALDNI
jgi:hypothetical protein